MSVLFGVLGNVLKSVLKKNEADDNVKTADPVVFEEVQKKWERVESETSNSNRSRSDVYKDFQEKVLEARKENEVNPDVETADSSVYDDLMAEIEKLKKEVDLQKGHTSNTGAGAPAPLPNEPRTIPVPQRSIPTPPPTSSSNYGKRAVTNSNGGSLQLRQNPDMGSPKLSLFVPDESLINILEYSDNSIILDGRQSRFVLVEYQGQRGWVLEGYLNFN